TPSLLHDADPIPHTRLGRSADLVVVAPATARVLGTYAAGISNDLLTATLLATEAPVVVCPAMHTEMWRHPAVQENIATLSRRGVHIVPPQQGRPPGRPPPGASGRPPRRRPPPPVPSPACTCWGPPAAPASRSIRSGSSGTGP